MRERAKIKRSFTAPLFLFFAPYLGADGIETVLDVFVAAVYLVDMVDAGGTFGTHGSDKHGDTRTDVRTGHVIGFELSLMVMAYYHRPVRVAKDDLRAHVDQFIDEEQTRLEHLLMNKYRSFRLGGNNQ